MTDKETIERLEKENDEFKRRIHTLEVYLEGAINYLILNGDVDNRIIDDVENILHITFNRNSLNKVKKYFKTTS